MAQPESLEQKGWNGLYDSLGRPLVESDHPYLDVVNEEWLKAGETPSVARAIKGLVLTETFRFRRPEGK